MNTTNLLDLLELPLVTPEHSLGGLVTPEHSLGGLVTPEHSVGGLVTPEHSVGGSAISHLWTWSLQFEIPAWFIALLILGLGLALAWELRIRMRHRETLADNMRRARTHSLFSTLR
jgi:hypothetical protein